MNESDFEKKLRRQAFRPLPREWKDQVLPARFALESAEVHQPLAPAWREFFWPNPVAWAGLAACWLVVWVLESAALLPGHPETDVVATALPAAQDATARPVSLLARQERRELVKFLETLN